MCAYGRHIFIFTRCDTFCSAYTSIIAFKWFWKLLKRENNTFSLFPDSDEFRLNEQHESRFSIDENNEAHYNLELSPIISSPHPATLKSSRDQSTEDEKKWRNSAQAVHWSTCSSSTLRWSQPIHIVPQPDHHVNAYAACTLNWRVRHTKTPIFRCALKNNRNNTIVWKSNATQSTIRSIMCCRKWKSVTWVWRNSNTVRCPSVCRSVRFYDDLVCTVFKD